MAPKVYQPDWILVKNCPRSMSTGVVFVENRPQSMSTSLDFG
ncbi:hypothetical protein [Lactobacillus equicursoris]|nr:hypothetical protein [Lactobacillus equicursoris]MDD6387285.1 hypothetical protein [Lactobacillus equicursoris]